MTGEPDRPDLAHKVLEALDRVARGQRAHRQRAATGHQLSPLQADLLVALASGLPVDATVGQLARELAVTQPTATDSIRSLEHKRLVRRRPDPSDGRRSLVELTPQGAALVDQLATSDRALRNAVDRLDHGTQLLEGLLELIAELVEGDVVDVARTCTTCRHMELSPRGRRCALLDADLPPAELRVNCPEHLSAPTGAG